MPSSALNRLPDELLLQVAKHLDPVSLYLLRQTSVVFSRLFGDRTFRRYHSDRQKEYTYTPFATGFLTAREQASAAGLL